MGVIRFDKQGTEPVYMGTISGKYNEKVCEKCGEVLKTPSEAHRILVVRWTPYDEVHDLPDGPVVLSDYHRNNVVAKWLCGECADQLEDEIALLFK